MSEHHRTLGVSPGASKDEIKKAWKKKVKENHPDRNPDDPKAEEKLREVNLAYEALTDPQPRQQESIWNSYRSDPWAQGWAQPEQNINQKVEIPYQTLMSGGRVSVNLIVPSRSPTGSPLSMMFHMTRATVEIDIPPGSRVGTVLRLSKGQHNIEGVDNISLVLHAASSRSADISGLNVLKQLDVNVFDVILSKPISVDLPHGPITIRLPRRVGTEKIIQMPGRGLTDINGRTGVLTIVVNLIVPEITDTQREELAKILDSNNP